MKIVHVIGTIDPAGGGPQAVVMRMGAAQAALGHEVHVVAYGDAESEARACKAAAEVPHFTDITRHIVPFPDRIEAVFAGRAGRALQMLIPGSDFIHIHGVWDAILRRAAAIARIHEIPYCVRPAGMLDSWSMQQKAWKKRLALACGYRSMLEGAAFIQVLNADEAELMKPLGLRPPCILIPNGVFLEEIEPFRQAGRFRTSRPQLGQKPFILFLSRLHHKKGLDLLADAFAKVAVIRPEIDLVVAGPDDGARAALVASINVSGVSERVHVVGPLFGRDKIDALIDAACFCLPSRQEGFSVAITEALACGCPVVISEACHFPEVRDAGAGAVVPLDTTAIAQALIRILDDPVTAARMSENGRELVRRRYVWPQIAALTLDAYATHGRRRHSSQGRDGLRAAVANIGHRQSGELLE